MIAHLGLLHRLAEAGGSGATAAFAAFADPGKALPLEQLLPGERREGLAGTLRAA